MFGYPSKCQRSGNTHPCTLSLACWLSGGSSQSGCGGNLWLVACCVKIKPDKSVSLQQNDIEFIRDVEEDVD